MDDRDLLEALTYNPNDNWVLLGKNSAGGTFYVTFGGWPEESLAGMSPKEAYARGRKETFEYMQWLGRIADGKEEESD